MIDSIAKYKNRRKMDPDTKIHIWFRKSAKYVLYLNLLFACAESCFYVAFSPFYCCIICRFRACETVVETLMKPCRFKFKMKPIEICIDNCTINYLSKNSLSS